MILFAIAVATAGRNPGPQLAVFVGFLLVSFTVSAIRARGDRWKHLAATTLVVWLGIILASLIAQSSLTATILGCVIIAAAAGLAGVISRVFR